MVGVVCSAGGAWSSPCTKVGTSGPGLLEGGSRQELGDIAVLQRRSSGRSLILLQ